MHPFAQRLHSFITRVVVAVYKAHKGERPETEKLFLVLGQMRSRAAAKKQQSILPLRIQKNKPMKTIGTLLLFLCLSGLAQAQTATSYLLLQGERLPRNEITVQQVKNICALEVGNDAWRISVKPASFQVVVSGKGSIIKMQCTSGVGDAAIASALEKIKAGDLVFIDALVVPDSVKAQVGQFALSVK